MITPRFNLSQTVSTLTIKIRAPYCNLSELDVSVDGNSFLFVCTPYYLRLNLPGKIVENETTKSSFDADSGEFTFVYQKENDEEFSNLDFITTFLQPKTVDVYDCGRKIEVLTSDDSNGEKIVESNPSARYGFAQRGGYNFRNVNGEFGDIFYIDPYDVKFEDRTPLRISSEQNKFDRDHYIADLMDDVEIKEIIKLTCPWSSMNKEGITFIDRENDFLKNLTNVNYDLSAEQIKYCHTSLLDILYAYCYDRRTTFYEGTCESDWTISNISASLCWFDSFPDAKAAIICSYRRSLIYPLYRSFALCEKVLDDLKCLLKIGIKCIVRCLIDLHEIFVGAGSGRYVLNKLFIDDYIVYMMKCRTDEWNKIVESVIAIKINKDELGLGLGEIERSVHDTELAGVFTNLKVQDSDSDEDSDDTATTVTSDSETDSSSESSENEDGDIDDKENNCTKEATL